MNIFITDAWLWFCIAFGLMLLTLLLMKMQERHFYTLDVIIRKFNIMDLQFAASGQEIKNLVGGMYALPESKSQKAVRALKAQLIIDFIFMPAMYGAIFLLCMQVSNKMDSSFGKNAFAVLAWLQAIPWLCDIIENIYLLAKINPAAKAASDAVHTTFQYIVYIKWITGLVAAVCALAALFYFWLVDEHARQSFRYLLILFAEIIVFLVAGRMISNRIKEEEKKGI